MSVELVCTACAARLRVPGFTPGRAVRCPKCASVFVPTVEPPAPPPAPVAVVPPPPSPSPPPPPPPPADNPFDFDKKPEPARTGAATKNAKIVGAPNTKVVPRATPVASKPKPPAESGETPAPKAKTADKPARKARPREPEPAPRPISPTVLVGGLAFLALGAAIIAGVLVFGGSDKDDGAKRPPVLANKDKVDPPKPPEPEPEPKPPEPEPEPKPPEPKPVEKFKPPLFPALNPPGPEEPVPEPEPLSVLVRPPARPAPLFHTRAEATTIIELGGWTDSVCVGGNGRFVLARSAGKRTISVIDLCLAKVVKEVPLTEADALVAAGNEYFVVLLPRANELHRWNLATLQIEAVERNPIPGRVEKLLMGHATDGPLLLLGPNRALDPLTLKEVPLVPDDRRDVFPANYGKANEFARTYLSANGRTLSWYRPGSEPNGLYTVTFGDTATDTRGHTKDESAGALVPGPDGTVFTAAGLFAPDLTPIGERRKYSAWHHPPIPAAHGPLYLSVVPTAEGEQPRAVQLCATGLEKPFAELPGTYALSLKVPRASDKNPQPALPLYERVFLVPEAAALAVFSPRGETLRVCRYDALGALARSGVPQLFVRNRPGAAVRGGEFRFEPQARSRGGPVRVRLVSGPPEMKVLNEAQVSWRVPDGFRASHATFVLKLDDWSLRESVETFRVPVLSAAPDPWPEPPAP